MKKFFLMFALVLGVLIQASGAGWTSYPVVNTLQGPETFLTTTANPTNNQQISATSLSNWITSTSIKTNASPNLIDGRGQDTGVNPASVVTNYSSGPQFTHPLTDIGAFTAIGSETFVTNIGFAQGFSFWTSNRIVWSATTQLTIRTNSNGNYGSVTTVASTNITAPYDHYGDGDVYSNLYYVPMELYSSAIAIGVYSLSDNAISRVSITDITSHQTEISACSVDALGQYLYCSDFNDGGIYKYSLSNPTSPTYVTSIPAPQYIQGLKYANGVLLAMVDTNLYGGTLRTNGVLIAVDPSTGDSIQLKTYDITGNAEYEGIDVVSNGTQLVFEESATGLHFQPINYQQSITAAGHVKSAALTSVLANISTNTVATLTTNRPDSSLMLGLRLWYKADDGTGTNLVDASGYYQTATSPTNIPAVTGKFNGGFLATNYSGNNFFKTPSVDSYFNSNAMTISLWFKTVTSTWNSSIYPTFTDKTGGGTSGSFTFSGYNSTTKIFSQCIFATNGVVTVRSDETHVVPSWGDGNWHFLTFTYDQQYLRVFEDGVLYDSTAHGGNINPAYSTINLPRMNAAGGAYQWDDFRYYDRALSTNDVWNLYLSGNWRINDLTWVGTNSVTGTTTNSTGSTAVGQLPINVNGVTYYIDLKK